MTITDAQDALIRKAAYRCLFAPRGTRVEEAKANAELAAFAAVAADVLGLVPAPFAFELAVHEAVRAHPLSVPHGATRERAAETRSSWEADIVAVVRDAIAE